MIILVIFVLIVAYLGVIKFKEKHLQSSRNQSPTHIVDTSTNREIYNEAETSEKSETTKYFFKLVGTDVDERQQLIQNVAKNYIKDGLIWGKYDDLSPKEIKELFPTEDNPIWEVSSLESIDVNLKREPNNKSDNNAISVRLPTDELIGYIDIQEIDKLNNISNRILSIKAYFEGGKYKYVDFDEWGDEKIKTGNKKYNFTIGVTISNEFSPTEKYIPITNDFSSSSFIDPIKPKLLTEIPNYVRARKFEDNYVVIDFETTGLNPETNEIIQIGAIKYENDIEVDRFNEYIKPIRSEISPLITKITGISDTQVKDSPTFGEKYSDFLEFLSGYTLVAHNAPFDMSFLLFQLAENTDNIPRFRAFDTLPPAKRKLDFLRDRKLETIKQFLAINAKSHNALDDCVTTAALYQYLKKH